MAHHVFPPLLTQADRAEFFRRDIFPGVGEDGAATSVDVFELARQVTTRLPLASEFSSSQGATFRWTLEIKYDIELADGVRKVGTLRFKGSSYRVRARWVRVIRTIAQLSRATR